MREFVYSKWSKRVLWFITVLTFSIVFIGNFNAPYYDACGLICAISLGLILIRKFLIDVWESA